MGRRVTIADVAEQAGVSYQTVSRVINDKPDVSPTTRQRVRAIIKEIDYRPSHIARSLATARTATIGLVVPDIANPYFSDIALGVEQFAYDQDYNVLLCNTNEDLTREIDVLLMLEDKRVDGVIVCGLRQASGPLQTAISHFRAAVLVNRELDDIVLPAVMIDDMSGGHLITQHLLNSGRRAIGFVAGPQTSYSGAGRMRGYQQALAEAGVAYHEEWVRYCRPVVEDGQKVAGNLLAEKPLLDALFCYNDLVAVGALRACISLGRRVPQDVAIVGFDDVRLAALVTPSLTTCRVPRFEIGSLAMELLLNRIDGSDEGRELINITPELVIRESAP